MAFTDYTSPSSVRALLGISEKEVRDVVVTDGVYLTALLETLYAISLDLPDDYLEANKLPNRTPAQNRFVMLADTVCAYAVALALIPNLPMSAPITITDGKSEQTRMSNPYEHLTEDLGATLAFYVVKLRAAYALVSDTPAASVTARTSVISVGTAFNPITGV